MAINETGHGINVSNFKKVIDTCAGYGVVYAPSNNDLKIVNMTAKWSAGKVLHETLNTIIQQSKDPINEREIAFVGFGKKITRVMGIVNSIKVSASFKADAKGLADKLRGYKVKVKKAADNLPDPNDVSKSHLSYVMRTENYKNLIDLLASNALYAPAEAELTVSAMTAEYIIMDGLNDAIGTIIAPVDQARIGRDVAFYNVADGIYVTQKDCKSYVKGLFGAASAEYKLVSKIKFTNKKL